MFLLIPPKKSFLFCESLPQHAKATDVLEMLNDFFSNQNFEWKKNVGSLCTDETPAMHDKTSGFATLVKKRSSSSQCYLLFFTSLCISIEVSP